MADLVPEDVLAEQDAEERRAGRVPLAPPDPLAGVPEDALVEQDVEARAAEAAAAPRTDDLIVDLEEP